MKRAGLLPPALLCAMQLALCSYYLEHCGWVGLSSFPLGPVHVELVVSVLVIPLALVLPRCVSVVVVFKSPAELPECLGPVVSVLQPESPVEHSLAAANTPAEVIVNAAHRIA